ncbi:MAG: hypothetical protein AUG51_18490 [Acidobacteria bacterium 13_1_20CM_3_53_8]|nr:MAG: hypothetical protein AUG51_18490 [Acidobacteria bacterium 13_1_20CM_3_53_8]
MFLKRLLASLVLASLFVSVVRAQMPATRTDSTSVLDQQHLQEDLKKKALALLDEVIKDIDGLKVPENRIHFKAVAADLLWEHNEQRARTLFRDAITEFNQLSSIPQTDDDSDGINLMPPGMSIASLRREILFGMARHDARNARNFLRSSRPSSQNSGVRGVEPEENLELNLAGQISQQDPQQALEMAEESLKKGYQPGLNDVLSTLSERDHETATKLAEDVFNKLKSDNLATNREAFDLAVRLLAQSQQSEGTGMATATVLSGTSVAVVTNANAGNQTTAQNSGNSATTKKPEPIFTQQQMRDLSEMVIAAAMSRPRNDPMTIISLGQVLPQLEQYAPERAAQLRSRMTTSQRTRPQQVPAGEEDEISAEPTERMGGQWVKYQQIVQRGNLNEISDAIKTAPPEMREFLLNRVIEVADSQSDGERVRQLINDNVTDPTRRNALLALLEQRLFTKAASEGRIEEARRLLGNIRNPQRRALALAELAGAAMAANNKKLAVSLLDEARNLVNYRAKNFIQLGVQLEVARSYALVDPVKSLSMLEPIIDQLNELISAGSVIGGFISEEFVRDDEIVMLEPIGELVGMFSMQYGRELSALATSDFARTKAAADRFQRPEVRLLARMLIARSILAPQSMQERRPGMGMFGPGSNF